MKASTKLAAKSGARLVPGVGEAVIAVEAAPVAWEGARRTGAAQIAAMREGAVAAREIAGHVKKKEYGKAAKRTAKGWADSAKSGLNVHWEFTKGAGRTLVAGAVAREAAEATYGKEPRRNPEDDLYSVDFYASALDGGPPAKHAGTATSPRAALKAARARELIVGDPEKRRRYDRAFIVNYGPPFESVPHAIEHHASLPKGFWSAEWDAENANRENTYEEIMLRNNPFRGSPRDGWYTDIDGTYRSSAPSRRDARGPLLYTILCENRHGSRNGVLGLPGTTEMQVYKWGRSEDEVLREVRDTVRTLPGCIVLDRHGNEIGSSKKNPKDDIYDPRLEHVRAITQGMYEAQVCKETGEREFRDASGMRADVKHGVHPNVFGMRTAVTSRWGLLSGQKATDEGARLSALRYAGLGTPTKADPDPDPVGFKHLVDNRQDYEETLAIPRKSGFYRVTPEHTQDGLRFFVWPMKPGERLPSPPHKTMAAAQKVADHLNKTADPRVTGKWWKPSKSELSAASLSYWLPPRHVFASKEEAATKPKVARPPTRTKPVAQPVPVPSKKAAAKVTGKGGLSYEARKGDNGKTIFVILKNGKETGRWFYNKDRADAVVRGEY